VSIVAIFDHGVLSSGHVLRNFLPVSVVLGHVDGQFEVFMDLEVLSGETGVFLSLSFKFLFDLVRSYIVPMVLELGAYFLPVSLILAGKVENQPRP